MMVIADIKRGDFGTTAAGYSNAFIGKTPIGDEAYSIYDVDFVTLNPLTGIFLPPHIIYFKLIFIILLKYY